MRLAVALSAVACCLVPAQAAAAAPATDPVYAYAVAHPMDLAGLDRVSRQHTGAGIEVQLNGVANAVPGAEAQRILDARWAARKAGKDPADNLSVGFVWFGTVARGIWD